MTQSFDHLSERLQQAIHHNPHFNGRTLRFETEEGRVILKGQVRTYFQKQMAQESVRQVAGVEEIRNDLEVTWS